MTNAEQPSKEGMLLVGFVYGDRGIPKFKGYTDWSIASGVGAGAYTSEPRMEVSLFKNTGTLDSGGSTSIVLPLDGFTDLLSDGSAHSRTTCTVSEKTVGPDGSVEVRDLFVGDVSSALRNYQGKPDVVRIDATCWKEELDIALGVVATHQCIWALGRGGCGFDVDGATEQGVVANIFGQVVTINGLSAQTGRWWHRGRVNRDGLSLLTKDWQDTSPNTFRLIRPPPAAWLNQVVTVVPGCDKLITRCRQDFQREQDFFGIGYAMLPYSPNFETV